MTGIIGNGTIGPAVLVLGATSDVGRGVVQAALEAGRAVVAVAPDADALALLHAGHPHAPLGTLAAPVASDADAAALASALRASGIAFEGVVAAIAGRHPCGRLIDQPADVLRRTLDEDLMPHLFAARHLFGLLPADGGHGYVLIGGPGGNYPWAGHGHCSIAAAALRMMARVLHDEAARHALRVQLLSLDAPVDASPGTEPGPGAWPKAVTIGRRALAMLDDARHAAKAVVEFVPALATAPAMPSAAARHATVARTLAPKTIDAAGYTRLPARDLRDARALLSSLSLPPPTSPGILHDETF